MLNYNENAARTMQTARLYVALVCSFAQAQHITLNFDNLTLPEKTKKNDMRALLARASVRVGDSLRYVIIQEYAPQSDAIAAYHIITDMPAAICEDICKRWYSGSFSVSSVNVQRPDTLPAFMLNPESVRNGRRYYSTSRNIANALAV